MPLFQKPEEAHAYKALMLLLTKALKSSSKPCVEVTDAEIHAKSMEDCEVTIAQAQDEFNPTQYRIKAYLTKPNKQEKKRIITPN